MSDCLNDATCSPKPSQAFPAPLPSGIPADVITYAFDGDCPDTSGLNGCTPGSVGNVSQALDSIEDKLCALNPRGISKAPNCSPIVVKNGVATPVTALEAINCLPDGAPGDVVIFNGSDWIIGPVLSDAGDCEYPCPEVGGLVLTSTGPGTAVWQAATGGSGSQGPQGIQGIPGVAGSAGAQGPKGEPGTSGGSAVVDCSTLAPLLDPASSTTCYPQKSTAPLLVLSTGSDGIGYRTVPSTGGSTGAQGIPGNPGPKGDTGAVGPAGPAGSGSTGSAIAVTDTNTVDLTLVGSNVSADVILNPVAENKLKSGPAGLLVLPPTCTEVLTFTGPAEAGGCIPTSVICAPLPIALMSHSGGAPSYSRGRPLYTAEVYPTSVPTTQTLSTVGSTLNDITSLMTLQSGDENGLCPGEQSMWDPALSRFTLTRGGRFVVNWGLFMRIVMGNSTTTSNNSLYGALRFVRPSGTVDGRTVSAIATSLRGGQYSGFVSAPDRTQDWFSTGSHTFIATPGTQLSLRAVAVLGSGASITSFVVRGDSGHLSISQLPDREF